MIGHTIEAKSVYETTEEAEIVQMLLLISIASLFSCSGKQNCAWKMSKTNTVMFVNQHAVSLYFINLNIFKYESDDYVLELEASQPPSKIYLSYSC